MKRRSVLQVLTAAPAAAGLLRAQTPAIPPKPTPVAIEETPVIEGTIPDFAGNTVCTFFSADQFAALGRLSDLIVPAMKEVPGALGTQAPQFLDFLVGQSGEARQKLYRTGLDTLNARSKQLFHVSFAETNQAQADEILAPLRQPWTARPDEFTAFLRTAKSDVLQATQSSQDWIHTMSKRVRSAGGVGTYWFPID
jgi:hypothetical protein